MNILDTENMIKDTFSRCLEDDRQKFSKLTIECLRSYVLIKHLEQDGKLTKEITELIKRSAPDCHHVIIKKDPVGSIIKSINTLREETGGFCKPWMIFISDRLYKIIQDQFNLTEETHLTLMGITAKRTDQFEKIDYLVINKPKENWIPITKIIATGT